MAVSKIHKEKKVKNYILLISLLVMAVAFFAITIIKLS
jgi:hypothetical protein